MSDKVNRERSVNRPGRYVLDAKNHFTELGTFELTYV
jgi:hypothetical protein